MPQFYPDSCFEQIMASDLLTDENRNRWISGVSHNQYVASKIERAYLSLEDVKIHIITRLYHGQIHPSASLIIEKVDLDEDQPYAIVTRIVDYSERITVLKRENEPQEEEE